VYICVYMCIYMCIYVYIYILSFPPWTAVTADPVARNSVRPLPDTYTRRMQSAASERTSTPKTGDDESPSSGGGCSTSSYRSGPAAGRRNSIRVMGPRTPRTADGAHQSTIASKAKDESADVPRGIPLPATRASTRAIPAPGRRVTPDGRSPPPPFVPMRPIGRLPTMVDKRCSDHSMSPRISKPLLATRSPPSAPKVAPPPIHPTPM
jgi:hypothetical protein